MLYNIDMNRMSLSEYLKSPCSRSSIPYWKQKYIVIPDDMTIIHDRSFISDNFADYIDETYFRLYHDLKEITYIIADDIELVTVTSDLLNVFVDIINASYTDLSVTKEQLESYRKTPVYNPDLWILLKDGVSGEYIGSGIADYDSETGELIIEWVQVLPSYRRHGYGAFIVNYLLNKMKGTAKFVRFRARLIALHTLRHYTGNAVLRVMIFGTFSAENKSFINR